MTTKEKLMADMKQAMKDREAGKLRLEVIRMVRSDIRNAEINGKNKEELTENEVLAVIMKAVKMREDSLAEFIKGKREDLIDQTNKELEILKAYFASVGATGPKEMGKVMKAVMPQVQGRADGKRINAIVKSLLQ